MILYEYPLNERVRTYLRLEHLFNQMALLLTASDSLSFHFSIVTAYEIIEVAARSDFRGELVRDIERQIGVLNGFRGNPAIAEDLLNQHLKTLSDCSNGLLEQTAKIGLLLSENEWLNSIKPRLSIPGGCCPFDFPLYHLWQQQGALACHALLTKWIKPFSPYANATQTLLKMLRNNGVAHKIIAQNGIYQQSISGAKTYQLLRVFVPKNIDAAPEVSANRLLFSLRMMATNFENLPHLFQENCALDIMLCQ